MGVARWIGGFLGFITTGSVLGALAGYAIGSLFEGKGAKKSSEEPVRPTQRQKVEGQRNSFLFSLLVLAGYVIKADGRVMHSEMEMLRRWLRLNFGEQAVQEGETIVKRLMAREDEMGREAYRQMIYKACGEIATYLNYSERLQLLDFLRNITLADGSQSPEEREAIIAIGVALRLTQADVESILNLSKGGDDLAAAYKVFGVSESATDAELKAAYRELVKKNHPDKVAALGEDVRRAAEKKMQEINKAKETIWKARGL